MRDDITPDRLRSAGWRYVGDGAFTHPAAPVLTVWPDFAGGWRWDEPSPNGQESPLVYGMAEVAARLAGRVGEDRGVCTTYTATGKPYMLTVYEPVRFGTHEFEVTLQSGEARATLTVSIGGNCQGFDVFDAAVEALHDTLPVGDDSEDGCEDRYVALTFPDGAVTEVWQEGDDDSDWLKRLVVGVRIVSWVPEA